MRNGLIALSLCAWAAACGGKDYLPVEELMDPNTCMECHPKHFEEWSSSMHAYAANDPVFLAMNQRGQEETGGDLGPFCVNCHAPMAVKLGLTTDGTNLADVPQYAKGVTCYFCHTVSAVEGDHNNPLVFGDDGVMRGGIDDPIENGVHATGYSALHDSDVLESSSLCGSCHDIVTPAGVHLERTFAEWKESVFDKSLLDGGLTCGNCHMPVFDGVVADFEGVPLRQRREHSWPGFDVAITDWPGKQLQLDGVDRDTIGSILPKLCVQPGGGGVDVVLTLDNVFAGHDLPSGAAQDRRVWVEISVERDSGIVFETGVVPDGTPVSEVAATDTDLWQIRDFATDGDGDEAHMFWDVRDVDSQLLPKSVTNDPEDPRFTHSVTKQWSVLGGAPDKVTATVYGRPIALDVIDDLIGTMHLDAGYRSSIPTFVFDATLEWTTDIGFGCIDPSSQM